VLVAKGGSGSVTATCGDSPVSDMAATARLLAMVIKVRPDLASPRRIRALLVGCLSSDTVQRGDALAMCGAAQCLQAIPVPVTVPDAVSETSNSEGLSSALQSAVPQLTAVILGDWCSSCSEDGIK